MQVSLQSIPRTLQEFSAMAQMDLSKPENSCAMMLCAFDLYVRNKDEGIEAVNLLRGPRPMSPFEVQFLRDRLIDKPYLPLAYFEGATPQNDYKPPAPYVLQVMEDKRPQDVEPGYIRVFLKTAGADSPRSVTLRQKDGKWYLWEYSGVLVGIRIPKSQDPWA